MSGVVKKSSTLKRAMGYMCLQTGLLVFMGYNAEEEEEGEDIILLPNTIEKPTDSVGRTMLLERNISNRFLFGGERNQ